MLESIDSVIETQNTRLAFFRDLSLGEKKTEVNAVHPRDITWLDAGLNDSQKKAVACALSVFVVPRMVGPVFVMPRMVGVVSMVAMVAMMSVLAVLPLRENGKGDKQRGG